MGNWETLGKIGKLKGNFVEIKSLKALAYKVLERNQQGNLTETESFHEGNFEGEKVSIVSNKGNTAFCYWLKSVVNDCRSCFEIEVSRVVFECPHFKEYWNKRLKKNTGELTK